MSRLDGVTDAGHSCRCHDKELDGCEWEDGWGYGNRYGGDCHIMVCVEGKRTRPIGKQRLAVQ